MKLLLSLSVVQNSQVSLVELEIMRRVPQDGATHDAHGNRFSLPYRPHRRGQRIVDASREEESTTSMMFGYPEQGQSGVAQRGERDEELEDQANWGRSSEQQTAQRIRRRLNQHLPGTDADPRLLSWLQPPRRPTPALSTSLDIPTLSPVASPIPSSSNAILSPSSSANSATASTPAAGPAAVPPLRRLTYYERQRLYYERQRADREASQPRPTRENDLDGGAAFGRSNSTGGLSSRRVMGEPSTSSGDEEYGGSPASDSGTEAIIERLRYALTVLIECAARLAEIARMLNEINPGSTSAHQSIVAIVQTTTASVDELVARVGSLISRTRLLLPRASTSTVLSQQVTEQQESLERLSERLAATRRELQALRGPDLVASVEMHNRTYPASITIDPWALATSDDGTNSNSRLYRLRPRITSASGPPPRRNSAVEGVETRRTDLGSMRLDRNGDSLSEEQEGEEQRRAEIGR